VQHIAQNATLLRSSIISRNVCGFRRLIEVAITLSNQPKRFYIDL